MRIIITSRQTLANAGYERILQRLVGILGVISKNPSNPNFDQYIFESLSALMRFEFILIKLYEFLIVFGLIGSWFLQTGARCRCLRAIFSGHLQSSFNKTLTVSTFSRVETRP